MPLSRRALLVSQVGSLLLAGALQAAITVNPFVGYTLTWDGNEGLYNAQAVPDNLALATNGATPIASSQLWPWLPAQTDPEEVDPAPYHKTVNLNDGAYGNSFCWIGGEGVATPWAGVDFNGTVSITSIAFGRDNALSNLKDRAGGLYTLQYTVDANPGADPDAATWFSIGTVFIEEAVPYNASDATQQLRHEFAVGYEGAPIVATGFRLLVPGTGMSFGTAIDELEVFGAVVPEPSTYAALAGALALGLAIRRRR